MWWTSRGSGESKQQQERNLLEEKAGLHACLRSGVRSQLCRGLRDGLAIGGGCDECGLAARIVVEWPFTCQRGRLSRARAGDVTRMELEGDEVAGDDIVIRKMEIWEIFVILEI